MAVVEVAPGQQVAAVVDTTTGRYRGRPGEGHQAFLGMRYANAGRFRPPVHPKPHAGVIDAHGYGAIAPQTNPNPLGPPPVILAHLPRPAGLPMSSAPTESEDCLFLNVWTPRADRNAKLPVMVWLHGGFFYSGSGAMGDGSRLAARGDVVTVSLNHRLNALGFTHLGGLAGGEFAQAGNLGMLDIVCALEWIRDNSEAFGGDPERIMVFGGSGGGMKTGWLMASPAARGLFARAGVQSGPALRFMERDRALEATQWLLHHLEIREADAADLCRVPLQRLLKAYYEFAQSHSPEAFTDLPGFAPVIDADLLPFHPFDPRAAPATRDVPMLIGANADEMSFFMGLDQQAFGLDEAGLANRAERLAGNRAQSIIDAYRAEFPALSPARLWLRIFSHHQVLLPTLTQAVRQVQSGQQNVFAYHFEAASPLFDGALGATHTLESAYVFNQLGNPLVGSVTRDKQALSRRMGDAWVSFAATGNTGKDWPAYGAAGTVMRIGDAWQSVDAPFDLEMALLAQG